MNAAVCPTNPLGHDWQALTCRRCDATRTPGEAIVSGLASRRGGDEASAQALLDAYRAGVRAEVFAEAAAFVGNGDTCDCGGCDTCIPRQLADGLRRMAGEEATAAAATATPGFFQPGHTYTREHHGHRVEFLVEHVATPPGGSHPVAFGWKTAFGWPEEPFGSDDLDGWTDTADTTQGDSL